MKCAEAKIFLKAHSGGSRSAESLPADRVISLGRTSSCTSLFEQVSGETWARCRLIPGSRGAGIGVGFVSNGILLVRPPLASYHLSGPEKQILISSSTWSARN